MKRWKRTVTLQLPLWAVLAAVTAAVILIIFLILGRTNFWMNLRLRTLDPEDVASITMELGGGTMPPPPAQLDREDIEKMTRFLNRVELKGAPYISEGAIGGYPYTYIVTLTDGTVLYFDMWGSNWEYLYYLNGKKYYICGPENGVPPLFEEYTQLHSQMLQKYN